MAGVAKQQIEKLAYYQHLADKCTRGKCKPLVAQALNPPHVANQKETNPATQFKKKTSKKIKNKK